MIRFCILISGCWSHSSYTLHETLHSHTGGEHALDEILDIAEHHSVSFCATLLACQRLDLDTL